MPGPVSATEIRISASVRAVVTWTAPPEGVNFTGFESRLKITCRIRSFWRPITAIRAAADDGNPATEADPTWVPLFDPTVPVSGAPLVTPGFPDHPAGHTCISSAAVNALQAFFGTDKISFTAVSNKCSPAPCPARHFDRFSVALKEIIDARVWGGIHFRTADVQGSVLGKKVAHYLEKHYCQPAN